MYIYIYILVYRFIVRINIFPNSYKDMSFVIDVALTMSIIITFETYKKT